MSADDRLDVCVVGFGAIGALYAYALDKTGNVRVTAVCRSNYDVLQQYGLDVESDSLGTHNAWKPFRVVRTVEEAADRPYAYIICASKSIPEITTTPTLLSPLLSSLATPSHPRAQEQDRPTAFVLLQNGIGIEDDLLDALSKINAPSVIISGCCWVDTTAVDGGRKVVQHGNEKLVLGYHPPSSPTANFSEQAAKQTLEELCLLFRASGSVTEAALDADIARWRKVLWNASFSTLCTLARAHVGAVLGNASSRQALKDIMVEVLVVARASLPPSAAVDEILSDAVVDSIVENENQKSVFRPSMLVDLDAGRPMEVEAIVGGVLKRARAKGVPTPRLDLLYAGLSVMQSQLVGKKT